MKHDARILITGAGGFIGGSLIESFFLNGFVNLRAGIRRWMSAPRIARFPVDVVQCDVLNPRQVELAVKDVDIIIHCAFGNRDVTTAGTEHLLKCALESGTKRVIHFSTTDVYGDAAGLVDEGSLLRKNGNAYSSSKVESEWICQEYVRRGLDIVVLRPTVVYGPFSRLWITKFAERLTSGNWGLFGEFGDGTCNFVYIQDLVQAVFRAVQSDTAPGDAFNIGGSESISWNDYFRIFNRLLGNAPLTELRQSRAAMRSTVLDPARSVARFLLRNSGDALKKIYQSSQVARRVMKRMEYLLKTSPSRGELEQFRRKVHYDISKARSVLGYEPRFGIERGLSLSVRWLRHETGFRPTINDTQFQRGSE